MVEPRHSRHVQSGREISRRYPTKTIRKITDPNFSIFIMRSAGLRIRLHRDIRRTSEHIAADSRAEQVSSSDCRSEIVASGNSSDMTQRLREVSKKSSGLRIDL